MKRWWQIIKAWVRCRWYCHTHFRRFCTYRFNRKLVWIAAELDDGVHKVFWVDYETYPADHHAWQLMRIFDRLWE